MQTQAQSQAQGQGHLVAVGQQLSSQQMPTSIVQFSSQQVQSVSSQGSAPAPAAAPAQPPPPAVHSMTESQEIPDSVTAELEKLEQEGGGISEVDNVTDILGGLVEDDDELLGESLNENYHYCVRILPFFAFRYLNSQTCFCITAEMGADFNILEYADPELGDIGEKTNILDENLDLEEPEVKKDTAQQVKTDTTETGENMGTEHAADINSTAQTQPPLAVPVSTSLQQAGSNDVTTNVGSSQSGNIAGTNTVGSLSGPISSGTMASQQQQQQQQQQQPPPPQVATRILVDANGEQRVLDGNVAISYQNSFPSQPPLLQRLQMPGGEFQDFCCCS